MPLNIRQLLVQPFGPYPDDDVLSDVSRKGTILNVTSLKMECSQSPIGFDESEYIGSPPPGSRVIHNPVIFYGKVEIESLDWLSTQGRQWLESDLRRRDSELNLQGGISGLTLARLYGDVKKEGSRITVLIQGEKNMSARFMTGSHPESFIIHSKRASDTTSHKSRVYNVLSMDVGTLETSQNFMTRYRLWALIDEIIKTDPDHTPLENRPVRWLVDNYIKKLKQHDRYRRLIFDSLNDRDVDAEGITTRRRYSRHVSRSDIVGLFAAHADWLLAQQLASNSTSLQKVNISEWISFCHQAKVIRRDAKRRRVRLGLPAGVDSDSEDFDGGGRLNLSRFGNDSEFWNRRMKAALKKQKPKLAIREKSASVEEDTVQRQSFTTFIYDSDFSEASTSSASDSENDTNNLQSFSPSTPSFCFYPPIVPAGRFEWRCPGCDYNIDLLSLATSIARAGDGAPTQAWKFLGEDHVQMYFHKMVSDHYTMKHIVPTPNKKMTEQDIKVEREES